MYVLPHLKILPEEYRCLIYKTNSGKTLAFFYLPSDDTRYMPCEAQSCQGEFPNIRALRSQASTVQLIDGAASPGREAVSREAHQASLRA